LFLFLSILPFSLGNFRIKWRCILWIFPSHKGKKNTLQQPVSTKVRENKRENLYKIKMKEINIEVRKNKIENLYKIKRNNCKRKIAYQTKSLNPKELSG